VVLAMIGIVFKTVCKSLLQNPTRALTWHRSNCTWILRKLDTRYSIQFPSLVTHQTSRRHFLVILLSSPWPSLFDSKNGLVVLPNSLSLGSLNF
jgi:hypothetical protein